ncbi:MAG: hypothetical protein VKJ64_21570 [Leptolyngbyaceae bacterium]|nr:hypothetical protein [Leptolyngbyaceae bacterium]
MSLLRNHLNAIAKRSGPIITVINLVGALSSTTALFLPNTPLPVIVAPSGNSMPLPLVTEKGKSVNGLIEEETAD